MRIALEILGGLCLLTLVIGGITWLWRQLNGTPVDEVDRRAGEVNPRHNPLNDDEDNHCCGGSCSIPTPPAPTDKEIVK